MPEDTSTGGSAGAVQRTDLRTFLIADVRGFTAFTDDRGDEEASALAARFAMLVRETAPSFDGHLLEVRGDEALCVFGSARQALRAAVGLQRRLRTPTLMGSCFRWVLGLDLMPGRLSRLKAGIGVAL